MMKIVEKTWGHEEWYHNDRHYCGKKLVVNKGKSSSLHHHKQKTETFLVIAGEIALDVGEDRKRMKKGDHIDILPGTWHRFTGVAPRSEIIEFSTQHFDEDTYRQK